MGTISRQIELTPTYSLPILIDEDKLLDLVKECVSAIARTHHDFDFTNETVLLYKPKRFLVVIRKETEYHSQLSVVAAINWNELDPICEFDEANRPFPNYLSLEQRLEIQKIIMTEI